MTKPIHIDTIEDVEAFFYLLYNKYKLVFHPDDSFQQYISIYGEKLFTKEEARDLDLLMQQCFDICRKAETDIYRILEPIQKAVFCKSKDLR